MTNDKRGDGVWRRCGQEHKLCPPALCCFLGEDVALTHDLPWVYVCAPVSTERLEFILTPIKFWTAREWILQAVSSHRYFIITFLADQLLKYNSNKTKSKCQGASGLPSPACMLENDDGGYEDVADETHYFAFKSHTDQLLSISIEAIHSLTCYPLAHVLPRTQRLTREPGNVKSQSKPALINGLLVQCKAWAPGTWRCN